MSSSARSTLEALPIAWVERETGVSKDTLRVWERRYGFPTPERGSSGERLYPAAQVEQLKIVKRLLDSGHRPRKTVGLDLAQLQSLSDEREALDKPLPSSAAPQVQECLARVASNDVPALRRHLEQVQVTHGLVRFVTDLVAPLNVAVGEAWMRGEIEVFQEHAYSQTVSAVLRAAIDLIADDRAAHSPRVLLTTLAQEPHGLGLLMAEAMLTLMGCDCLSLGTQTPVSDIFSAARVHRIDIVALSFTGVTGVRPMAEGLSQLRSGLPDSTEIWAGGQFARRHRKHLGSATVIGDLSDVRQRVLDWRRASSAPAVDVNDEIG